MNLNTSTTRYECPEGHIFIKIADLNGRIWIDATIGHTGEQNMVSAHVFSALAGTAIRGGVPALKVAHIMKGCTHEDSNHLLARNNGDVALSMADAIGREIEKVLCDT